MSDSEVPWVVTVTRIGCVGTHVYTGADAEQEALAKYKREYGDLRFIAVLDGPQAAPVSATLTRGDTVVRSVRVEAGGCVVTDE